MFNRKQKQQIAEQQVVIEDLQRQVESLRDAGPRNAAITYEELTAALAPASATGIAINERTVMRASAVYRSVALIGGAVAGLPLVVYRTNANGVREAVPGHDLVPLLNQRPAPAYSAAVFWEFAVLSMLLRGDQYAFIARSRNGKPVALYPLPKERVTVTKEKGDPTRLFYTVSGTDMEKPAGVQQEDMLHVPNFGFNGLNGLSTIQNALRNAAGLALASEEYSARFFGNGTHADVVLEAPGRLDEDQANLLRQSYAEKYQQGVTNAFRVPLVLTQGLKANQLRLSAEDTALIASREFQVEDIARIFGVPPHMIGRTDKATSWGTGVEQMSRGFVMYTLKPHLTRIEQELNAKLLDEPDYEIAFDVEGLLRGDLKTESEYLSRALGGSSGPGWMTVNEVRKRKGLPPIEGGDELTQWTQGGTNPASPDTTDHPDDPGHEQQPGDPNEDTTP